MRGKSVPVRVEWGEPRHLDMPWQTSPTLPPSSCQRRAFVAGRRTKGREGRKSGRGKVDTTWNCFHRVSAWARFQVLTCPELNSILSSDFYLQWSKLRNHSLKITLSLSQVRDCSLKCCLVKFFPSTRVPGMGGYPLRSSLISVPPN